MRASHISRFRFLLIVICLSIAAQSANAQASRKWTDNSGKFTIVGTFVSEADGTVTLDTEDGAMEIPLSGLSDADQKFIKDQATNPFKKKAAESPFKPRTSMTPGTSATGSGTAAGVAVDWSGSEQLPMPLASTEWTLKPDPSDIEITPCRISMPGKTDFFEGATGFAVNEVAGRVAAGYHVPGRGRDRHIGKNRLVLADIQRKRSVATASFDGTSPVPLTIHDDGNRLLVRNEGNLEIWTANGKDLQKTMTFDPYPEGDDHIVSAWTLANNQFATWNGKGKLAVWDFETAQPLYHISTGNEGSPALSPNRKYIAFVTGSALGVLDTTTKEIVASVQTPRKLNWPTVVFSPSGEKLACASHMDYLIWNFKTGELDRDTPAPNGVIMNGRILFPNDNFLLLGNQHLIELENRLQMWNYSGMGVCRMMGKFTAILLNEDNEGAVLIGEIPHPPVYDELKKALTQPDLFIFRKGIGVQLDISGVPNDKQAEINTVLIGKLQEMNCKVDPAANVKLVAKVSGPTAATRSYMHSGDHKVTVYTTTLEVIHDGKVAWQQSNSNIPFMLSLKSGENVGSKLAEYSKGPSYSFYSQIKLPEFVQKPSENTGGRPGNSGQSIGTSKVSAGGIR